MVRIRRIPFRTLAACAALLVGALVAPGQPAPADGASSLAAKAAREARALSAVSGDLAAAQQRLNALDADLATRRARLNALQTELARARARLVRLRLRLEVDQQLLAQVLVADYEADRPDLMHVILNARGFADLVERIDNAKRVAKSDAHVVGDTRKARAQVDREATTLARLQRIQQRQLEQVVARQEAAATIRARLAQQRLVIAQSHARTVGQIQAIRARQRRVQARLAAAQRSGARSLAPPASQVLSGGGFTFPMPGGTAIGPGSWSLDQGVDISAPGHTPLLAVRSGTIVGHGIGGFGNDAPILHLDDGRYVYYGHAGPGNAVTIGTHVSAGQVISEVGAGIVGISTGPHLEIGFSDGSGTPLGPQTAPAMMALLRGAYHG